ncbi:MAG: pullulanase-associated domain-containing protein, partial [Acidobacteriota bacterium]
MRTMFLRTAAAVLAAALAACAGSGPDLQASADPGPAALKVAPGHFLVHYHRHGGDYDGWTLWTWDDKTDQDSRELQPAGVDDYGIYFDVDLALYGDGLEVGVLPKFGNWESKDAPDRIWTPELGNQVWILSGHPKLFAEMPDVSPAAAGAAALTVHYHRPDEDYQGWTLWTWNDITDQDS